jgi:hypothetical protein
MLKSAVPATWKVETGKLVQGQPGQKICKTPHLNKKKLDVCHAPVIPATQESKERGSRPAWEKQRDLTSKIIKSNRAADVAQMVCLPNKNKTLNSHTNTDPPPKKERKHEP